MVLLYFGLPGFSAPEALRVFGFLVVIFGGFGCLARFLVSCLWFVLGGVCVVYFWVAVAVWLGLFGVGCCGILSLVLGFRFGWLLSWGAVSGIWMAVFAFFRCLVL